MMSETGVLEQGQTTATYQLVERLMGLFVVGLVEVFMMRLARKLS